MDLKSPLRFVSTDKDIIVPTVGTDTAESSPGNDGYDDESGGDGRTPRSQKKIQGSAKSIAASEDCYSFGLKMTDNRAMPVQLPPQKPAVVSEPRVDANSESNATTAVETAPCSPDGPRETVTRRKRVLHPQQHHHQRSPTKFGKANPVRDALLFAAFVGILLLVTVNYGDRKTTPNETKATRPAVSAVVRLIDSVNDIQSQVSTLMASHFQSPARTEDCSVFWDPSSIPGAGWGLFAGQDWNTGDVVVPSPSAFLLTVLGNKGHLSPHALLVKHHPTLVNVQGRLWWAPSAVDGSASMEPLESFQLRAIRPIAAGSELFVAFDLHPHGARTPPDDPEAEAPSRSLFHRTPTPSDYAAADQIWDDADSAVRWLQSTHKQWLSSSGRGAIQTAVIHPMVQRAIGRVDPLVARLLPSNGRPRQHRTTAVESLHNRTIDQLRRQATCLSDDVLYHHGSSSSCDNSGGGGDGGKEVEEGECAAAPLDRARRVTAVAGRTVATGEVLTKIPVLVLFHPRGVCASATDCRPPESPIMAAVAEVCLDDAAWRVRLCPLLHGPLLRSSALLNDTANAASVSNVRIQWTQAGSARLSLPQLMELGPTAEELVWEVRATRSIAPGDTVRTQSLLVKR